LLKSASPLLLPVLSVVRGQWSALCMGAKVTLYLLTAMTHRVNRKK